MPEKSDAENPKCKKPCGLRGAHTGLAYCIAGTKNAGGGIRIRTASIFRSASDFRVFQCAFTSECVWAINSSKNPTPAIAKLIQV